VKVLNCDNCGVRIPPDAAGALQTADGKDYCAKCAPLISDAPTAQFRSIGDEPTGEFVPVKGGGPAPVVTKFYFCETCGKRITDKQIQEGLGRDKQLKGVYCKDCAVGVMTMEMSAINIEQLARVKQTAPASKQNESKAVPPTPRRPGGVVQSRDIQQGGKTPSAAPKDNMPTVLLAIGAIVIVIGAMALVGSSRSPQLSQAPAKHSPPSESATQPLPTPVPPARTSERPPQTSLASPAPVIPEKAQETAIETPMSTAPQETEKEPTLAVTPVAVSETPTPPAKEVPPGKPTVAEVKKETTQILAEVMKEVVTPAAPATGNKGRDQFAAVLKDISPLLRQNHFAAALELLDARRCDPAFASVSELIDGEKADVAAIQSLRNRGMEALRAKEGKVVTLKKGGMTGTVKLASNNSISLALKDGPELAVGIDQLDADDIASLAPLDSGPGKAEHLRQLGLLFIAAGNSVKAEDCLIKSRDAGSGEAARSLERIAAVKQETLEAKTLEAWKKAEALFAKKDWKSAKQAYEAFRSESTGSTLLASNAAMLKERLEAIGWELGPPRKSTLELGGDVKIEMVLIPAGEFEMGSNDGGRDEKPVHKVKILRSFYMGKYVVTQAQYEKVMGKNPSALKGETLPVDSVNYIDAEGFCKKASKFIGRPIRLPTEAEWEYACRAGTKTKYYTGDDAAALEQVGWFKENAEGKTHPVGQKKSNAWGLFDMQGNVLQWCQDWFGEDYYGKSETENPQGPSQKNALATRLLRGSSRFNDAVNCRSARRTSIVNQLDHDDPQFGFRVVAEPVSRVP
jgi:formylglycine-generating enzyme required for sulfatase activity